jgi:WD40 repeat protein
MNFRFLFGLFICGIFPISLYAQGSLGIFDNHQDVGKNVKNPGSAKYDVQTQEYTITGSGINMWGSEDQMHYVWKSIQGDFIVRAHIRFIGDGVDPHRKAGWTIRNNFDTGSPMVNASLHGDGLTSLQFRRTKDAITEQVISPDSSGNVIQLERRDGVYYMSTAKFGEPFTTVKIDSINLRNEVFAGIYVCSHNQDVYETAVFSNVRIVKPPKQGYIPYTDYIGSHMELMDVNSGHREILFSSAHSIQAPNWTPDGKTLIYNSNGYLYNYDMDSKAISMLNTGFAVNNNNDHILSLDGKDIAISNHSAENNGVSTIYTLPISGNDNPQRITPLGAGASYLHGWSPDKKDLIYTAHRKDQYDIYKINLNDKKEIQLTNLKTLDDGSEFSPDGKYIYFNSARTGTMQIWRMNSDGSEQTQLTSDEFNDWFPHVSPDGKWIVMISYLPEVNAADHPFYKQVYLRLMPVDGGKPKVIAYLFGGQGTINVPSWSPDSKKITFVSNSDTIQ